MFGQEPIDFEAQIAEINASAERRRGILARIAQAKEAAARIAAHFKAKPKRKISLPKAAPIPKEPAVSPRLMEMTRDFYERNQRPQPPDPWDEDAKDVKKFRTGLLRVRRRKKKTKQVFQTTV